MSFLLDALRKSEQAGRQRAAPTIHSAAPASAHSDGDGEWLPVVLMVLPAFLLMSWFGLHQFEVGPKDGSRPMVEQPKQPPTSAAAAGQQPAKPESSGEAAEPVLTAPAADARIPQPAAEQPRTPVEKIAAQPAAAASDEQAMNAGPAPAVMEPKPEAVSPAQPANQIAQDSVEPRAIEPAAAKPSPPPRDNHVDYWELPGDVRQQLPEFRISVLVYAERPEERFILINGQRQYEGDALQSGLVLREIRREGVIYSYRNYRFLVTQ